jgi:serine/threonine protein kinase
MATLRYQKSYEQIEQESKQAYEKWSKIQTQQRWRQRCQDACGSGGLDIDGDGLILPSTAKRLGFGGSAAVYEFEGYAIKIQTHFPTPAQQKARKLPPPMEMEAGIYQLMADTDVTPIYYDSWIDTKHGITYLVLEKMDGSLGDLTHKATEFLSNDVQLAMFQRICYITKRFEQRNLILTDLSANNFLYKRVGSQFIIKLADFSYGSIHVNDGSEESHKLLTWSQEAIVDLFKNLNRITYRNEKGVLIDFTNEKMDYNILRQLQVEVE